MSVFDRLTNPDPARVRDEMIALKEPERRKRAKAARVEFELFTLQHGRERPSNRWHAATLAWVGTATARTIGSEFWRIGFPLHQQPALADDVYAVLASRGRKFFETLARLLLRNEVGFGSWTLVRRGVREGLIDPPEGDDYVRRLVHGIATGYGALESLGSVYEALCADPELLEREVWQLFEIDAGSELANAVTWAQKEPGKPAEGWTRGDNRWINALTRLADEGRLDRGRLLDASLDALMRDFRASTVGWYARLHEELEPTRDERVERLDRYLALVTSPAPAVVKEGLGALRAIEDDVPPDGFARVAPTPFTQRQKNLSVETLSLLARLAKAHPGERGELLDAATHALAHERADVQERALKLLEQYPDEAPRASLLSYVDAVSPTLRPRVEALTGVAALEGEPEAAPAELEIREPVQPELTQALVLETRSELVPVESVDELIELAAALLEGQGTGDDCERFLDGVSRLCDQRPQGFDRRTASLAKRSEAGAEWGGQGTGAELIAQVVRAWTRRRRARTKVARSRTILGFLAGRAEEVGARAARGVARPLLATPTHSGGWIDPAVLDVREQAGGRIFNRPDPLDRLQARLRAFPEIGPLLYERRVKTETHRYLARTSRDVRLSCAEVPSELGELAPIVAAAGAAEQTGSPWYWGVLGWAGFDALGVRWALTVLPSLPEVAFAGAATAAVEAREGSAYHHPDAVLEHALDPHVPLRREAWLATSACLVAKSPEIPRVAVDLLVASVEDGRFDPEALAKELAWLVDEDFAKVNRLEAPLHDVARISRLHAAQVVRTVEATLACLTTRPHGLHALLEVGVEGATATGSRIEDEQARAALEGIAADVSPSSKLGKLARALLAA